MIDSSSRIAQNKSDRKRKSKKLWNKKVLKNVIAKVNC